MPLPSAVADGKIADSCSDDYYDVEQIEEFVAFMGAYEIESMFKEFKIFMTLFIDLKI